MNYLLCWLYILLISMNTPSFYARINETKELLSLSLFISLFCVSLIIYILYLSLNEKESIFTKITMPHYEYLNDLHEKVHAKIYDFTKWHIATSLLRIPQYIYDYYKGKSERIKRLHFAGIILLIFIPRIVCSLLFVFEIHYDQKLYWFYWSLPFLLLVYIYKYILYIWSGNLECGIVVLDLRIEAKNLEPVPEGEIFKTYDIEYYLRKVNRLFLQNKIHCYEKEIHLIYDYYLKAPDQYEQVYEESIMGLRNVERWHFVVWLLKLYESKYSHNILVFSLSLYAAGWFSIYLYSIKQEFIMTFYDKLQLYQDAIEPFSGVLL